MKGIFMFIVGSVSKKKPIEKEFNLFFFERKRVKKLSLGFTFTFCNVLKYTLVYQRECDYDSFNTKRLVFI